MSNPADTINQNGAGIVRHIQANDNLRARDALSKAIFRLRWSGRITEDKVKDSDGNDIVGKYKIQVTGFDDPLDGFITRVGDVFKKNDIVEVNVDSDLNAWILSPSLPRAHGLYLCLMIIDEKDPGTWGVSYPRMVTSSAFGVG